MSLPIAFSLVVVGVSWLGTDPRPWWALQQFGRQIAAYYGFRSDDES